MPPKKPTESEARKGIEKIIDSKRKPPVKTLTKGVDKESTQRTKGISSVASSVSKMQNNMSKKIIEVERLSSEKSISKVQSSMTKILGSLNNTIANLATGVKDITIQTAKASKDAVSEYGRAISQDINVNKQSVVGMALSRTSPLFGYFAAKLTETSMFQKFAGGVKNEIKSAMGGIGASLKSGASKLFSRSKDKANDIGSGVYAKAKDKINERKSAVKKTIPKMASGGFVEKGGLAQVHSAEVVMPIEKVLDKIDENQKGSSEIATSVSSLNKNLVKSTQKTTEVLKDAFRLWQMSTLKTDTSIAYDRKRTSSWFASFINAYKDSKVMSETDSKKTVRLLNSILKAQGGEVIELKHMWTKILTEHPVIRTAVIAAKVMKSFVAKPILAPAKFLFKGRGGYKGDLPKGGNVYSQMVDILGLLYVQGMTKLDNIKLYTKSSSEALREVSSALTGKKHDKIEEKTDKSGRWSMLSGMAYPIKKLVEKHASEQTAEVLTGPMFKSAILPGIKKGIIDPLNEQVVQPTKLSMKEDYRKLKEGQTRALKNTLGIKGKEKAQKVIENRKDNAIDLNKNKKTGIYEEANVINTAEKFKNKKTDTGRLSSKKIKKLQNKSVIATIGTYEQQKKQTKLQEKTVKALAGVKKTIKRGGKSLWKWIMMGLGFIKTLFTSLFNRFLGTALGKILSSSLGGLFGVGGVAGKALGKIAGAGKKVVGKSLSTVARMAKKVAGLGGKVGVKLSGKIANLSSTLATNIGKLGGKLGGNITKLGGTLTGKLGPLLSGVGKGVSSLSASMIPMLAKGMPLLMAGAAGYAVGTLINKYMVGPFVDKYYKKLDKKLDEANEKSSKGLRGASKSIEEYRAGTGTKEAAVKGSHEIKMRSGLIGKNQEARKKDYGSYTFFEGEKFMRIQSTQESFMNKNMNEYLKYGGAQVNKLRNKWLGSGGFRGVNTQEEPEKYGLAREAAFLKYLKSKGKPITKEQLEGQTNLSRKGVIAKVKGAITDVKAGAKTLAGKASDVVIEQTKAAEKLFNALKGSLGPKMSSMLSAMNPEKAIKLFHSLKEKGLVKWEKGKWIASTEIKAGVDYVKEKSKTLARKASDVVIEKTKAVTTLYGKLKGKLSIGVSNIIGGLNEEKALQVFKDLKEKGLVKWDEGKKKWKEVTEVEDWRKKLDDTKKKALGTLEKGKDVAGQALVSGNTSVREGAKKGKDAAGKLLTSGNTTGQELAKKVKKKSSNFLNEVNEVIQDEELREKVIKKGSSWWDKFKTYASKGISKGKSLAKRAYKAVKSGGRGAREVAYKGMGSVAAHFESGGRGAGTISTGKGDRGGASYGIYQLSSKMGTLQKFLNESGLKDKFKGLVPGTKEFNAKWKEVNENLGDNFSEIQHKFIKRSHYDIMANKLRGSGLDLAERSKAVKEAVWSTAVQFGPNSSIIRKALSGMDLSKISDSDFIKKLYAEKSNVQKWFSKSPKQHKGLRNRFSKEQNVLMSMIDSQPTSADTGVLFDTKKAGGVLTKIMNPPEGNELSIPLPPDVKERLVSAIDSSTLAKNQATDSLMQAEFIAKKNKEAVNEASEKQAGLTGKSTAAIVNNVNNSIANSSQNTSNSSGPTQSALTSRAAEQMLVNQICSGQLT